MMTMRLPVGLAGGLLCRLTPVNQAIVGPAPARRGHQ